jgi:predicted thioesterase
VERIGIGLLIQVGNGYVGNERFELANPTLSKCLDACGSELVIEHDAATMTGLG